MKKHLVICCWLFTLTLFLPATAHTQEPPPLVIRLPSEQEQQAKSLFHELHCMVCNGQSLAESDAQLAQDMRNLIREQMRDGKDTDAIKQFLTKRYGDAILMQPPVKSSTWILWFAPFVMLLIGSVWTLRHVFTFSSPASKKRI